MKPHGKENEVWPWIPLNTTPGEALAQDCQEIKYGRQRTREKEGSGSAESSLCTFAVTTLSVCSVPDYREGAGMYCESDKVIYA